MEFTSDHARILQETHDNMLEVKTVLLGKNGDPGLCGEVNQVKKSHSTLKRNFWILVGLLIGSGVIASSVLTAFSG